jgi:hypothetical protein
MIALLAATAILVTVAFATTATAPADVGDEHWFAHGAAIAASDYTRKQQDVDIPWMFWKMDCQLTKRVDGRARAECTTHTTRQPCKGEQCRAGDDYPPHVKRFRCEGSLRVRQRTHGGALDAWDRHIDCERR